MDQKEDTKMDVEEVTEKTNGSVEQKKPGEATSSPAAPHFRVKVSGLPRFYTPTDPLLKSFKKFLSEMGLSVDYIRSPKKGNSWLYITFFSREDQEKALKLLKHYVWQDRTLICTLVVADVLKRKQEESGPESKRIKLDIPLEEQMLMATIPYHAVSYEEQISKKNEEAECLFRWLTECMEKRNPQLIGYIDQEMAKNVKTKVPFDLQPVKKASLVDGYRNKCEFRIAMEAETKKIVIGYRVDNQVDENIAVAPPDALRHLPREMINLCKVFEQFVQDSPYVPQTRNHDPGVWRLFHVRINKAREMLVVVLINPTVLDDKKLSELKLQLIYYFSRGAASKASGHNVVSLYVHLDPDIKLPAGVAQAKHKRQPQTGVMEHIWGELHLVEQLLDLTLDIDPNFYFQNNTYGAEELYKTVTEVAEVDKETVILDLCCGSGGMGMTFARKCKQVIGVEVLLENVVDAKRLATKNGLTNCEFLQGAVDDLLPQLEEKLKGQKVIPILDPPRVGISTELILWLRKFTEIQQIIYVCSNHKMPTKNIVDLSSEQEEYKNTTPFIPKKIIPVDISPHSLRCEMVILLERLDLKTLPKPTRGPKANSYFRQRGPRGMFPGLRGRGQETFKRGMGQLKIRGLMKSGRAKPRGRGMMRGLFRGMSRVGHPTHNIPMRETMYPLPLREHLHFRSMRPMPDMDHLPLQRPRPYDFNMPGPVPRGPRPRRDFEYSDFRRDFEDAIDSYETPRRGPVRDRLAMANAMLEKGMRLAEEAMADDYDYSGPSQVAGTYIGRRGRGSVAARGRMVPPARLGMDDAVGPPRMGMNERMRMGVSRMNMGIDDEMRIPPRMGMGARDRMGMRMGNEMGMVAPSRMGRGRGMESSARMGVGRGMDLGGGYGMGADREMRGTRMRLEANSWGGWGQEEDWAEDSQDCWQSAWDGDNYNIIPPKSGIASQRGTMGFRGAARARGRGQSSGGFWRH